MEDYPHESSSRLLTSRGMLLLHLVLPQSFRVKRPASRRAASGGVRLFRHRVACRPANHGAGVPCSNFFGTSGRSNTCRCSTPPAVRPPNPHRTRRTRPARAAASRSGRRPAPAAPAIASWVMVSGSMSTKAGLTQLARTCPHIWVTERLRATTCVVRKPSRVSCAGSSRSSTRRSSGRRNMPSALFAPGRPGNSNIDAPRC